MYRWKRARSIALSSFLLVLLSAPYFSAAAGAGAAPANAAAGITASLPDQSIPAEVQSFAVNLIQALSSQSEFSSWGQSEAAYDPLGPGTHSWLVSLSSGGHPAGYLIITAKPGGGLALAEYGVGPNPLYNPDRLNGLTFKQMEPLYGGPTLTQWRIRQNNAQASPDTYIEAGNGELLPDTDRDWSARAFHLADSAHSADSAAIWLPETSTRTATAFNPNDNLLWMVQKALPASQTSLTAELQARKKLVFFSSGKSRTYAQSLPINGYQLWKPQTDPSSAKAVYIRSETEGNTRYILLDALYPAGQFLAWTGK